MHLDRGSGGEKGVDMKAEDEFADAMWDNEFQVDPLADLLFTLVTVVLFALIILLPAAAMVSRDLTAGKALPNLVVQGQQAAAFLASGAGLQSTSTTSKWIATDLILADSGLRTTLENIRDAGKPLLLIIAPDGLEAAFEFEAALSLYGPKAIYQVRLGQTCKVRSLGDLQECGFDSLDPADLR